MDILVKCDAFFSDQPDLKINNLHVSLVSKRSVILAVAGPNGKMATMVLSESNVRALASMLKALCDLDGESSFTISPVVASFTPGDQPFLDNGAAIYVSKQKTAKFTNLTHLCFTGQLPFSVTTQMDGPPGHINMLVEALNVMVDEIDLADERGELDDDDGEVRVPNGPAYVIPMLQDKEPD